MSRHSGILLECGEGLERPETRQGQVATSGIAFAEDRCVRLPFATLLERLEDGLARIRKAQEGTR